MPIALPRSKVKKDQTWNAENVFASPKPLTDPQRHAECCTGPIEDAFEVLGEYIDRLETLTSR